LCRAVARCDGRKWSSEGFASGVGESLMPDFRMAADAEDKSCMGGDLVSCGPFRSASKRVRLSLCVMG
jgi:hypothetical protein